MSVLQKGSIFESVKKDVSDLPFSQKRFALKLVSPKAKKEGGGLRA